MLIWGTAIWGPLLAQEAFVAGQLLVQLAPGTKVGGIRTPSGGTVITGIAGMDTLNRRFRVNAIRPLLRFSPAHPRLAEQLGLTRTYVVELPPTIDVEAAVTAYQALPEVAFAEPNYLYRALGTPNDSLYPQQWAWDNRGQAVAYGGQPVGVADCDVDMPGAWGITTGSSNIILAIIDTGVDYLHPEFAGRVVAGYDFINNDADPMDDNGHGTACAGIAAATGNNGIGVAGANWGCRIMPVKVFDGGGGGTTIAVANGFIFAADSGARVLSFSGGGAHSLTLQNAIDYADSLDCLIFAARGNAGTTTPVYPASYPNVVAVGALSPCNERKSGQSCDGEYWWASSYGADVDFVAPGVRIHTTDILGPAGFDPGDYLATFNGTSAATPHASGVGSLIRSLRPNLTAAQVRTLMQQTADDIGGAGFDYETGHGRLNAFKALVTAAGRSLAVNPPDMDFGRVAVGDTASLALEIFNPLSTGRTVTFSVDNGVFVPGQSSLTLGPGEVGAITITFIPPAVGGHAGTLTCDAGDTVITVPLNGTGVLVPDIALIPAELTFAVNAGDSAAATFTVENRGTADLSWNITGLPGMAAPGIRYSPEAYEEIPKGMPDRRHGVPVTEGSGGPDHFGYIWRDSDDLQGPTFAWVDISTTGTPVTGLLDDNYVGPFPIGFTFSYYGKNYTEFYIASNGFIGFGPPTGYNVFNNIPIPHTSTPNNILAWCWDDFRPLGTSRVYYHSDGTRLIVQFVDYEPFTGVGTVNAEVILEANGTIRFQYLSFTGGFDVTSSSVGIESPSGGDGLGVVFNAPYLHDSLAVEFTANRWLSVTPTSGTVPPGGQNTVTVSANSAGLLPGVYPAKLTVHSNDPDEGSLPFPVTLHVSARWITFSVNMSLYQSVGYFNPAAGDYVTVRGNFNEWVDSLAYQLSPAGGGIYQATLPLYGAPGDTVQFKYFIHAGDGRPLPNGGWEDSVGVYGAGNRGFLLTGGNQTLPTVYFNNNSQGFPAIMISPDTLKITVSEGDTNTAPITLSNTGFLNLNWEMYPVSVPGALISASTKVPSPLPGARAPDEIFPPEPPPGIRPLFGNPPVRLPFRDGFEDGDYAGWMDDGGAGTREVTTATAAVGQRSFHYIYTGTRSSHRNGVHLEVGPGEQPAYVSFYIRSGTTFYSDAYVVLVGDNNREVILFFARSNGFFYVNADVGGNVSARYVARRWYHIEFRNIDWINQRFDYYVDGQLIQAGIPFRNAGLVHNVARVYLYNFDAGAEAWWDEIYLGEPPVTYLKTSPGGGAVPAGSSQP
ncbi:MAG: choice-of-anchor D domain-containing protein, partial [Calditrichaeota bacterium]